MKNTLFYFAMAAIVFSAASCSDDDNPAPQQQADVQEVIDSYVNNLVLPNLKALNDEATDLNNAVIAFLDDKTADNLTAAQEEWLSTRVAWEQSEAMLFGPVEDNNFDPRIDSWPVDFNDIQDVWNSGDEFTEDYINGLADELKGFHPIEFLLFGENGDAQAGDFTDQRKQDYLKAMSLNLKNITDSLYSDWDPADGHFGQNLLQPGSDNSKYDSKQAVMIEIVNAMAAIVSEVGDSKLKHPFNERDPQLAESPFSKNSFTDFTYNLIGAQNVYLGGFGDQQGTGLSAFVQQYNKDLDARIKAEFQKAINNLKGYDVPYSEAIVDNRSQVQESINLLDGLRTILENELVELVQLQVKD